MTHNLVSTEAKVGLSISTAKVKSVRKQQPMVLKVNQREAEEVENFTYLGSSILNKQHLYFRDLAPFGDQITSL